VRRNPRRQRGAAGVHRRLLLLQARRDGLTPRAALSRRLR
jgi:hypothetical protein